MNGFNISEWALRHATLVWFLMAIAAVAGVMAFTNLGREEDPSFAIKTMVVQVNWPGATLEETMNQVTDRIETELKQVAVLDYTKSFTTPGQATVFVNFVDSTKAKDVPAAYTEVRRRLADIWGGFPAGVQGPFFNDQFGDVYGNIYAFTAEGVSFRQLRDYMESAKKQVSNVPNAGKIQIIGAQDEAIYLANSDITAILCANDRLALGALKLLHERGLNCPNDISVTGFNDMQFLNYLPTRLTTIRIRHFELGQTAARILIDMIDNPEKSVPTETILPVELALRDSAGPPRRA